MGSVGRAQGRAGRCSGLPGLGRGAPAKVSPGNGVPRGAGGADSCSFCGYGHPWLGKTRTQQQVTKKLGKGTKNVVSCSVCTSPVHRR